jgi:hypothetical protein
VRRTLLPLAAAAALGACGGGERSGDARASSPSSAASATSASPGVKADAAHPDEAIAVHVDGGAARGWVITGSTSVASSLEVSVEDGKSVVFGPETVPVKDGRFRVEVPASAAAGAGPLQAYVGDAAGRNQVGVTLWP